MYSKDVGNTIAGIRKHRNAESTINHTCKSVGSRGYLQGVTPVSYEMRRGELRRHRGGHNQPTRGRGLDSARLRERHPATPRRLRTGRQGWVSFPTKPTAGAGISDQSKFGAGRGLPAIRRPGNPGARVACQIPCPVDPYEYAQSFRSLLIGGPRTRGSHLQAAQAKPTLSARRRGPESDIARGSLVHPFTERHPAHPSLARPSGPHVYS